MIPLRDKTDASEAQAQAARPDRSVWVSANAGAGKTTVLTHRVARLLLAGADPARILCLTFTRAAAAEMRQRLFRMLGEWALLEDEALRQKLDALLARDEAPIRDADLPRARRLFATALETPGGLKIQTIHAFCQGVLGRFPLEAGVPPQLKVLDEAGQQALLQEAAEQMAREMQSHKLHPQEREAFDRLLTRLGGDELATLLAEIAAMPESFGAVDERKRQRLRVFCGVLPEDNVADAWAAFDRAIDRQLGHELMKAFSTGTPTDHKDAFKLGLALTASTEQIRYWSEFLLTKEGKPRAISRFPSKAVEAAMPGAKQLVQGFQDALLDFLAVQSRLEEYQAALDVAKIGERLFATYAALKRRDGVLDFDDLIRRTAELLQTSEVRDWVRWKLDGGIDHVLIDEAQDTAPIQWQPLLALTEEFWSGETARSLARTLFVVGDQKQSIYSFQGASPTIFTDQHAAFVAQSDGAIHTQPLLTSFRSGRAILTLVDTVFADPTARAAAGADAHGVHHVAGRAYEGRIEIWPPMPKPVAPEPGPWYLPVDQPLPGNAPSQLAEQIAQWIAPRIGTMPLESKGGRLLRAGDIMILCRKRSPMAGPLLRALKRVGVAIAGADRLRLLEQPAAQDALNLIRFALDPDDDLVVAEILRGVFCDVDEQGLYDLAQPRSGRLWDALQERAHERAEWAQAAQLLHQAERIADYRRPYEFLSALYTQTGVLARAAQRMNAEAVEALEEMLAQALAYEGLAVPQLQGFLAWIEGRDIDLKREQTAGADELRVMTVHGAKGLEAPVVILADATAPVREPRKRLLRPADSAADDLPLFLGPGKASAAAKATRKEAERQEHLRLLYVAATRAEEHLIVTGIDTRSKNGEFDPDCWWLRLRTAAEKLLARSAPHPQGAMLVLGADAPQLQPAQPAATPPENIPQWRAIPPTETMLPVLRPSALGGEKVAQTSAAAMGVFDPALRGQIIHAALEQTAAFPPAERPARARQVMQALVPPELRLGQAWRDALDDALNEVLGVLATPFDPPLFEAGSLAEVPVAARPDAFGGQMILGVVDRLVVLPDRLLIVDFKTGMRPQPLSATPEAWLRQLAAYRAALEPLYQDRVIEAAILWTAGPQLVKLPADMLDAALKRIQRAGVALVTA